MCVLVVNVMTPPPPSLLSFTKSVCLVCNQFACVVYVSFVPVLGNNPNTAEMSELVSLAFRRKKNLTFNVTSLI